MDLACPVSKPHSIFRSLSSLALDYLYADDGALRRVPRLKCIARENGDDDIRATLSSSSSFLASSGLVFSSLTRS